MLEKIKKKWQEKIEKNAFESILTYTDPKGKQHTEKVYFKRSQMPFIEKFGDWGRIYPPLNPDGSINRLNLIFGGWRNLIKLIAILIIVGLVFLQFYQDFILIEQLQQACPNIPIAFP